MPDHDTDTRLGRIERDIAALKDLVGGLGTDTATVHPGIPELRREVEEIKMILALVTQLMVRIEAKLDEPYLRSTH